MEQLAFIPMMKVDEAKRLVIGRALHEYPDRSGEILDFEKSKPHIQAWSEDCARRTNGKSKGNLREQHRKDLVAGHLTDIRFDDVNKSVEIVAHISDDNTWRKVLSGSLSGFSVGGKYGERELDKSTGLTRYTALPQEISIVDAPCIPTCQVFDMVKADGSTVQVPFNLPGDLERVFLAKAASDLQNQEDREFTATMCAILAKGY